MATTKTKKTAEKKEVAEKAKIHPLVIRPRITEKSALSSEKGIYTFNVKEESTKNEIKKAIKMLYGVNIVKVCITPIKSKTIYRKGKMGTKSGGKKAVVYLKKGEKISFA